MIVQVSTPYVTRLEIKDHLALENLPRDESAAALNDEMKAFSKKKKREEEEFQNLFESGKLFKEREEKMDRMARDLEQMKSRKPDASSLFGDPPDEE